MNSNDVLRDLNNARVERRRVFVRREENNGKIRWTIEIEASPVLSQFNTRLRDLFRKDDEITWGEGQ